MAKKSRNKNEENDLDLLENPEAIAEKISRGEEFVRANSNRITYVLIGILAVIIGGYFYVDSAGGMNLAGIRFATAEKETEAQEEMFQAQYYFEADSLNKALNGDGNAVGFLDIIADYSTTNAANLANFYAGVCYLKQGNYDDAIEYLSDFSSSDLLMQARAYSLIGDANMEQDNLGDAIKSYTKASNENPNLYFTPIYLMKLAVACEKNDDMAGAIQAYDRIITEFPTSAEKDDARKYKALAEGLAGK